MKDRRSLCAPCRRLAYHLARTPPNSVGQAHGKMQLQLVSLRLQHKHGPCPTDMPWASTVRLCCFQTQKQSSASAIRLLATSGSSVSEVWGAFTSPFPSLEKTVSWPLQSTGFCKQVWGSWEWATAGLWSKSVNPCGIATIPCECTFSKIRTRTLTGLSKSLRAHKR